MRRNHKAHKALRHSLLLALICIFASQPIPRSTPWGQEEKRTADRAQADKQDSNGGVHEQTGDHPDRSDNNDDGAVPSAIGERMGSASQ